MYMGIQDVEMRNGDKLPIRQFKLEKMCINPAVIMVAKRGSGKSWVIKAMLAHFKDIPAGLIIAPTDRMNCFYANFFPESYIHYEYKPEILSKLLARQEAMIDKVKEKEAHGKRVDPRAYLVMDDCLGDKKAWANDKHIAELMYNGRHYQLMFMLTMQTPLGIKPELRSNFDYIFLLKEDFISNQKKIFEHYAGMFPNFDAFRQVFMKLTANHSCMVIDNKSTAENPLAKILWYKAPDLSGAKIEFGCKQFREYHEKNYDPKWKKNSRKGFDFFEVCKNKKKSNSAIDIEKEEVDDNGNVIDQRLKSTRNYEKKHK